MGECLFARRGSIQTPPVVLKSAFADNSWAAVIRACQRGKVPNTWKVGDQMPMTIGGVEYLVDIIGKNHDAYADGSGKAPLTFQLHNLYNTQYAMDAVDNSGGWAGCDMRLIHLPKILAAMPREVRDGIREVTKQTSIGNQESTIEETADKLFLLSETEVFSGPLNSFAGEGVQYAYYGPGDVLKTHIGSDEPEYWHERSPYSENLDWYCCVSKWGEPAYDAAWVEWGVAPAFCF